MLAHSLCPLTPQLIFADEYDEFNAYVAENIDRITKRAPKEVRGTLRPCSQQALAIRYPRLTHKAPLPFSPPPSECRPRRRS